MRARLPPRATSRERRAWLLAACLLATCTATQRAAADGPPSAEDQALATTLFREGKALLEAGKVAEACRKLDESQRLDPGGGTLLNLAVCHEKEGKTATAWAEFRQARDVAEHDHRDDRIELADEHAKALEAKLSKLTVHVPAGVDLPDMELLLDQRQVRRPAWGTQMPVDPGVHTVEARAPGKKAWHTDVDVLPDADRKTLLVPAWEEEAPAAPTPAPAIAPVTVIRAEAPPPPHNRTPAIVAGSIGVAGVVLGSIFGVRAFKKHDDSAAACTTNPCGADSVAANDAAKTAADVSTVAFAVGLVGLGVGTYLWLSSGEPPAAPRTLRITPFGVAGTF